MQRKKERKKKKELDREIQSGGKLTTTHGDKLGKLKRFIPTTVNCNPPCIPKKVQKNSKVH